MRATVSLTAAVLVLGTGLVACGGGDGNGEADEVERTARLVTTDKTAACERLTTAALAAYAEEKGPKALSACKSKIKDAKLPKSTDVEVFKVTGTRARVGYHTSDDVTGAMELKRVKGRWVMDRVVTILP